MRVLVCGGRDYDNWKRINKTMSALDKESSISLIIQGGAKGAELRRRTQTTERPR